MASLELILYYIMILLTVILIPFALKSSNRKFTLAAIVLPLIANVALYVHYGQTSVGFGYLAIVGAISLLLIRKKDTDKEK